MSAADYVAIAISPALIMVLVGSLVFFLIEIAYAGNHQLRINYVFALFVFAAVLIARISIEAGSQRAIMFSLPLGIAVYLVLQKFLAHPSSMSSLVNLSLIAIIWWSAHRLTWDCTFIDDRKDASGEGLMQQLGLGQTDALDGHRQGLGNSINEILASSDDPAAAPRRWWHQFFPSPDRPHTPGLWVLYFSLAALPLFGLGQWLIPASDAPRRRTAFLMLTLYLAAAMALLVTTSFLGFRRYLRQRRITMPAPITVTWVLTGAVLLVAILLMAALLPRPSAEYAISAVLWQIRSPGDTSESKWALGSDGVEGIQKIEESKPTKGGEGTEDATDAREGKEAEQGEGGEKREEVPRTGEKSEPGSESGSKPESGEEEGSEERTGENGPQGSKQGKQSDETHSEQDARDQTESAPRESDRAPMRPPGQDQPVKDPPGRSPETNRTQPARRSSRLQSLPDLSLLPDLIVGIFKLILYAVILVVICILAWKYRHRLAAAWIDILRDLRKLLANLYGEKKNETTAETEQQPAGPARPTFAAYHDPFTTGQYGRMPPEQLLRYTFDALVAWARDHGTTRTLDETPYELVRRAIPPDAPMFEESIHMARLYSKFAYATPDAKDQGISGHEAAGLRQLWVQMRETQMRDQTV